MSTRLLEAFFRHWFLLLLPLLLIPPIVSAAVLSRSARFESTANIWVDRATYLQYTDELDRYLSPAQSQSNKLVETMQTVSFMTDVAKRTPGLAALTPAEIPTRMTDVFTNDLTVNVVGQHLVRITADADSPELAYQLVSAVLAAFRDKVSNDRVAQAQLAISFYESNQKAVAARAQTSTEQLRDFIAAHPGVGGNAPLPTGTQIDPKTYALLNQQLREIQRQNDQDLRDLDQASASLDRARLDIAASQKGLALDFQVLDPPVVPTTTTRPPLRKLAVLPLGSLLLGFALTGAMLVVLVATDRGVRTEADLGDTRVLGLVPRITPRGVPRRSGPVASRRAVGFIAGATLPQRQTTVTE